MSKAHDIGDSISGALFSGCNKCFRYALWRIWDRNLDNLLFIGLNPSTASEHQDDPTIRRLISFAKGWGFGGLFAGNLFSVVSPDPTVLFFNASVELPGGSNDQAIKRMRELSTLALVGWGNWGEKVGLRPAEVLALIGEPVYCLKTTKAGEPIHPLYQPAASKLARYYRKGVENHDYQEL